MTLLCALNDDGTFSKSFNCIYPGELETKLEQSGGHACFLDLVIKIEDGVFAYKLFDKEKISINHILLFFVYPEVH